MDKLRNLMNPDELDMDVMAEAELKRLQRQVSDDKIRNNVQIKILIIIIVSYNGRRQERLHGREWYKISQTTSRN